MTGARAVVDHLFSRGVLGSILVGGAVGKVVEKLVILGAGDATEARLVGWVIALLVFVGLYVYWADFEAAVDDGTDAVTEAAEDVADALGDERDG